VRPVAEFFYEEEFGQAHTLSALVGAIWQVKDSLSFDVGFRHAITNGANINEVRAGLTFGFPLRQLGGADPSISQRVRSGASAVR
jgi:long-subunit fatty acid transport protein